MLNNNEHIKKHITTLTTAGPSPNIEHLTMETDRITSYYLQAMDNIRVVYIKNFQDFSPHFVQELAGKIYEAAPRME